MSSRNAPPARMPLFSIYPEMVLGMTDKEISRYTLMTPPVLSRALGFFIGDVAFWGHKNSTLLFTGCRKPRSVASRRLGGSTI